MRCNIESLAKSYVLEFYKYLIKSTKIESRFEVYILFRYTMCEMFGLDSCIYGYPISEYGDDCVRYMNSLKLGTVSKFSDRVALVDLSKCYLVALGAVYRDMMGAS